MRPSCGADPRPSLPPCDGPTAGRSPTTHIIDHGSPCHPAAPQGRNASCYMRAAQPTGMCWTASMALPTTLLLHTMPQPQGIHQATTVSPGERPATTPDAIPAQALLRPYRMSILMSLPAHCPDRCTYMCTNMRARTHTCHTFYTNMQIHMEQNMDQHMHRNMYTYVNRSVRF